MKAAAIILASLVGYGLAAPAGAESNAPAPGSSRQEVCAVASLVAFERCLKTTRRPNEKWAVIHERCNKDRGAVEKGCLDAELPGETVVDGPPEAVEDESVPDPQENESISRSVDLYCQRTAAAFLELPGKQSVIEKDQLQQICRDEFKTCGIPGSRMKNTKAWDCAINSVRAKFEKALPVEDKSVPDSKKEDASVPNPKKEDASVPDSKKEDKSTEQPNTSAESCPTAVKPRGV